MARVDNPRCNVCEAGDAESKQREHRPRQSLQPSRGRIPEQEGPLQTPAGAPPPQRPERPSVEDVASQALTRLAEAFGCDAVVISVCAREDGAPRVWTIGVGADVEVHRSLEDGLEIVVKRGAAPSSGTALSSGTAPSSGIPGSALEGWALELVVSHCIVSLRHRLLAERLRFERGHD